jgi:Fe2+ transport system protein FeoA
VFVKEEKVVTAAAMVAGQSGAVLSVDGGHTLLGRLEALGIRPGKKLRKVSSSFLQGPAVFDVEGYSIAIGFGMANRILIKIDS